MEPGSFYQYGEQSLNLQAHPPDLINTGLSQSLLDDDDMDTVPDIYTKIFIGGLNSITTNGKYDHSILKFL